MQTMSVRAHTLSGVERLLEDLLVTLEHLGERSLCDDLTEVRERLFERMAAEQEGAAA